MIQTSDFRELMEKGLVYRYSDSNWEILKEKAGKLFPSPTKTVKVNRETFIEELIQPPLEPIFISSEEKQGLDDIAGAWNKFLEAQLKLLRELLSNEDGKLLAKTIADEEETAFADIQPGYSIIHPYIRLDSVRTDEGWKILDINSTRPAGVGDNAILAEEYQKTILPTQAESLPILSLFLKTTLTCFQEWQSYYGDGKERLKIGVLSEIDADWQNFRYLADSLAHQPEVGECLMITALNSDLKFYLRSRIKQGHPWFKMLAQGYPEKHCVISPLFRRWMGNKLWFFLFKSPPYKDYFLSEMGKDYYVLEKAFPETGLLEKGEVKFPQGETIAVEKLNRKDWIIKTPRGSSAKGLLVGRDFGHSRWLSELEKIYFNKSLMQKFYRDKEVITVASNTGEPTKTELYMKYGVFIFNGELAGCEAMARPSHIVHGARDTYLSCVFIKKNQKGPQK